ncbi:MAG: type II toxin-antitoxin system HicB family antitoxin [Candidatus Hydrogenedentes bacterium]|nr:type II toxin-antitoxin system HicB family antitoxin [Candidatus Hydrogenedentota bacterium]
MSALQRLTVIIEREDDGYVALCPEYDIASQGGTVEEARQMLAEAMELFLETASESEIVNRQRSEVYVSTLEVRRDETQTAL